MTPEPEHSNPNGAATPASDADVAELEAVWNRYVTAKDAVPGVMLKAMEVALARITRKHLPTLLARIRRQDSRIKELESLIELPSEGRVKP